jgi:hypothetical protein
MRCGQPYPAAKQQHNDTIKSNQISREAYTSVQRAFVFVKELQFTTRTGMDPVNPGNYPELWWFSPIIENSGGHGNGWRGSVIEGGEVPSGNEAAADRMTQTGTVGPGPEPRC